MKRRKFLGISTLIGASTYLLPNTLLSNPVKRSKLKLGFIGTGLRGQGMMRLATYRNDVDIPVICDIDDEMISKALKVLKNADRPIPKVYNNGDEDFQNMLENEDLDGVFIATPWEWHHPMSIAAMKAGKHVGTEVPAALTVPDCWDLVNTSEQTGKFCMIMENVCYRRDVLAVLNMVRSGLFGELLHCQGGYQHDIRDVKFNNGLQPYGGGVEFGDKGYSESKWRTNHSINRNGDLYPTHGLGPVSTMLNINHGNRMLYLTSTATQSRGLHNYVVQHGGPNHPNASIDFKLGDIITTVIKCANGQTIMLSHDTNSPRPYSLNFRIQGTKGLWMKDSNSIYVEGISPNDHRWESDKKYLKKYDHTLWKKYENEAKGSGHGGMDFFVFRAFVESIKRDVDPPLDVYDAASWSVISPLSEKSIKRNSTSMNIPDFTRGKWKTSKPKFAINDIY